MRSLSWSYGSWIYNYLCTRCLSLLKLGVWIPLMARCTTLCDQVCQWLATGRWFSPGTPGSSTSKTDRHDIAEILLKMALNIIKQNQIFRSYIMGLSPSSSTCRHNGVSALTFILIERSYSMLKTQIFGTE